MTTLEIERRDVLRDRLHTWGGHLLPREQAAALGSSLSGDGRRFRFFLRLVLVVISMLSGGLLYAFLGAVDLPQNELVAAVICIAAAELVRWKLRWRHTGAEEGWTLAGAWLVVVAFGDSGITSETLLSLLAIASAAAAIRSRAPLFNGLAFLFVVGLLDQVFSSNALIVIGFTLAVALGCALARGRRIESPFVELSLIWTQIAAVLAAAFYAADNQLATLATGVAIVILIVIGLKLRDVVTLWTAVPLMIVAGYDTGRMIPLPLEWRLAMAGIAIVALTAAAERALRQPRNGWTSQKLGQSDSELLEIAATIAITPSRDPATESPGGGSFGGGGATERW